MIKRICTFSGLLLAGLALVVFLITTTKGPAFGFFDSSARLIVQHTGTSPFDTTANPLWDIIVRLLAALPLGTLAFRLNVFSAICGALAVWLIYSISANVVRRILLTEERDEGFAHTAAWLAGTGAALFLTFSIPFWTVSNRAHTASFDILLLLSIARLFLVYTERGSVTVLMICTFLYGIGIVEFASFIVLFPLFAGIFLYVTLKSDRFRTRLVVQAVLAMLVGLCFYFIAAWRFYHSPAFQWTGFDGYRQILTYMLTDQFRLIAKTMSATGWIMVLMTTAAPFIIALLVGYRSLNGERQWGFYLLHVVLTGIVMLVLFDHSLSPRRIIGPWMLLVTPYVLAAFVFGYLVAYWYLTPIFCWSSSSGVVKENLRRAAGIVLALAGISCAIVAAFRNATLCDARPSALYGSYANRILDNMGDRPYLISDGIMDPHVALAARQRKKSIILLTPSSSGQEPYMNYVASLFSDVRIKSLANVGIMPLLEHWFRTDPDIEKKAATLGYPDLWISAGLTPVPDMTVYLGTRQLASLNTKDLLAAHVAYWDDIMPAVETATFKADDFFQAFTRDYLVRGLGMMANNLGVLCQDIGHTNDAASAYQRALEMDPDNISAMLNQLYIEEGRITADKGDSIKKKLEERLGQNSIGDRMRALSQLYGYVWMPEAFASLGWNWALSGNRPAAINAMSRALGVSTNEDPNAQRFLADLYMEYGQDDKSEALHRQILDRDPANMVALRSMARISAKQGKVEASEDFLSRVEKAGLPAQALQMENAVCMILSGRTQEAKALLEQLVETDPSQAQAVSLLTSLVVSMNDKDAMEKCAKKLAKIDSRSFAVTLALAQLSAANGQIDMARRYYSEALTMRPATVPILEALLRLDMVAGDEQDADKHVRHILTMDPENSLANYVLGTLQVQDGDYALAEDSFRRSLSVSESPLIMNDLAWVLYEQKKLDEALRYAMKSLTISKTGPAWDTLGMILIAMNRFEKAKAALDNASELSPDSVEIQAHRAILASRTGQNAEALRIAGLVSSNAAALSKESREEILKIQRRAQ